MNESSYLYYYFKLLYIYIYLNDFLCKPKQYKMFLTHFQYRNQTQENKLKIFFQKTSFFQNNFFTLKQTKC
jgi:hypothetical protein